MNRGSPSLDVLLFLVLAGASIWISPHPSVMTSLVVLLAGGYFAAHIFLSERYASPIKLALVWLLVAVIGILPALGGIILRHWTGPVYFVHDGVIQTEEAVKFLLAGKNPYAENYLNTPMALWSYDDAGGAINPGLYHLAYWPFLILFSIPFYLAAQATLGWFDERMLYVPMIIVTLMLLSHLVRTREKQRALILLAGLNPVFLPYFIEGRNDIFVLFWLVLSFTLLQHQHRVMGLGALAFACATKPTAWFILPFYAIYLFRQERFSSVSRLALPVGLFAAVMAVIVLPFLIWDPRAFIDDVWNYTAGTTTFSYPINSLGFGAIGLALGWIPDRMVAYPFALLQLAFGLPALVLLVRYQLAKNTSGRMWLCYGFLTLILSFFSRVFNDNHFGFIISLVAIGLCLDDDSAGDQSSPLHEAAS